MSKRQAALAQNSNNSVDWDVVKWVLPSISALLVVLGYLSQLSHNTLIGFDPGLSQTEVYITTTGNFFGWLINLPQNGWQTWRHALFEGADAPMVCLALAIVAISLIAKLPLRKSKSPRNTRLEPLLPTLILGALIVFVYLKVQLLDVPLSKINGLIIPVASIDSPAEPQNANLFRRLTNERDDAEGLARFTAERALRLWNAIACVNSRNTLLASHDRKGWCSSGPIAAAEASVLAGEGLAHAIVCLAIICMAIRVIRTSDNKLAIAIAWVAAFSTLSLTATFGKLGHSMYYEYSALEFNDESGGKSVVTAPASGLILQSNSDWLTIATPTDGCKIKLWRISNSQIRFQRELYRTNLIGWNFSKTLGCEPKSLPSNNPPAPPGSIK